MRKLLKVFIVFILVIILGILYFKKEKIEKLKISQKEYIEKIITTGTVEVEKKYIVFSEIDGKIEKIYKKDGDIINKSENLLEFDKIFIENKIEIEKFNLKNLKTKLKNLDKNILKETINEVTINLKNYQMALDEYIKFKKLYEKKYISQLEYNQKKEQLNKTESLLKKSQIYLKNIKNGEERKLLLNNIYIGEKKLQYHLEEKKKYLVKSNFGGIIIEKYVNSGEILKKYDKIFKIISPKDKYISIKLDEKYKEKIKMGQKIKIFPLENTVDFIWGEIIYIAKNIDEKDSTLEIKGSLSSNNNFLYKNTVNIVIESEKIKNSYLVPEEYIYIKNNKKYICLLKNNKKILKEIKGRVVLNGFLIEENLGKEIFIVKDENIKEDINIF
ncbi:Multidrug efflux pump subunit AcrA (membrane-fusion protein) [Cetobacterium ceti]|uniref:Multidrug efflux pump subunit AcrA (Membrane-fusion protein) n=1 Tax=Cetobacterium ceti TaxID=180163 RepID=A0A1T4NF83_9FUSO|nr:efflux RND transporter periplasmic adaptor subunit [Cetobacterium ceti]SJZ77726.1 Multidrug efflux pump subunit AcrA (membrane-fusion protein) [Cetobacterium ceti]